jgi:membrane peptidoglycan carboxypeptidase
MTRRAGFWLFFGLLFLAAAGVTAYELIASPLQAMFLSDYAARLTFHDVPGPSDQIRFPKYGPSDVRFGYTRIPEYVSRLTKEGYSVTSQARISDEMADLDKFGLFLPYREKSVAGLTLEDCAGTPYYQFRQPHRAYPDFKSIPAVVANTLLFIENRELLDPNHPQRNPAVEWDRLGEAVLEKMVQTVQPGRHVPGGSTLATQIEKYRHSEGGLTMTAGDKLRQMGSASIRAYLDGPDTRVTRRRIVLDYLNTVPLSAAPGFGEVNGLADGLKAWFGLDFDRVNRLLARPELTAEAASDYKHVLALLISQRKPSWYLGVSGRDRLDAQANKHLGMLAEAGIISPAFRDLARAQRITFRDTRMVSGVTAFVQQKAVAATRNALASMLGVERLYDLDRTDLTVTTSLHTPTQQAVTDFLTELNKPETAKADNLYGNHMLSPGDDLNKIIYSFTLYERTQNGAALRVQADNYNHPFDVNQMSKLGMGSSAKLRTLTTYLEIITELHDRYGSLAPKALDKIKVPQGDVLTRWAVDYLRATQDRDLATMLRAAMSRRYSANVNEGFYTGGGLHYFVNFEKSEDAQVMDIWEAFRRSVNLPFVRLMRDIVHHFMYDDPNGDRQILENDADPRRIGYLKKFADQEGTTYLIQFHKKYRGLNAIQVNDLFFSHIHPTPRRLAAIYRYFEPNADLATFTTLMKAGLPDHPSDEDYAALYAAYGPDKFNLADRAYIAQVHPLELWLVAYLRKHPDAHWDELEKASAQARQDSYVWLFKTGHKAAQDIRIQTLLEADAFKIIHARWQRLGYPFASLVPSYATAIGSSADRPAALAELMGIILNDGVRQTAATIRRLDFASNTPYHTRLAQNPPEPIRLMPVAEAQVMREALVSVVANGTAIRTNGAFVTQQGPLTIGGKTGTGDNRFETFAANGTVLESRAVNRVATFVFFIGRHFYGVITAYVPGEAAGNYKFSSALPVQVLRTMAPILQPLLAAGESRSLGWQEDLADFEAATEPKPVAATPGPEINQKGIGPNSMLLDLDLRTAAQHAAPNPGVAKAGRAQSEPLPLRPENGLSRSLLPVRALVAVPEKVQNPAPLPAPAVPKPAPEKKQRFELSVPGEGFNLVN